MQKSQSVIPISESDNRLRFTLRMMFAATAALAVLFWTGMDSIGAMLLVGIPLSLIGFGLIGGQKWNLVLYVFLAFWGGLATYIWFSLPYWTSPIELPRWAWGVKVSSEPYIPMNVQPLRSHRICRQVLCYSTVNNCILAAEKIVKSDRWFGVAEFDKSNQAYIQMRHLLDGISPKSSLFTIDSIENGILYEGDNKQIWIDTDRGIFYYLDLKSIYDD